MTFPSFDLPLWVICTSGTIASVFLYALVVAVVAGIFRRNGQDGVDATFFGVLWPITISVLLIGIVPYWIYKHISETR